MSEFNRMTIVAAAGVLSEFHSHSSLDGLDVQWGIAGRYSTSSKSARIAGLAKIAIEEEMEVMTEAGMTSLPRAVVEEALKAPEVKTKSGDWLKLLAGLRFDGFEVRQTETEGDPFENHFQAPTRELVRMLPEDIPGADFREAESEVFQLLDRHGFAVSKGHLKLALSEFQRGNWSPANGELRKFFEDYLNEIASALGYIGGGDSKQKRDFLGKLDPPFLLTEYNEWNENNQKPQYIQGLMSRMHPHGGHPGLSEEEDATFRLQITLVTARLMLRRFDKRKSEK